MATKPPSKRYPLIRYLRVENAYASQVQDILRDAARQLERDIRSLGAANVLTRAQMQAQRAAIKAYLAQNWTDISSAINLGQRAAASEAAKVVGRYEAQLLRLVVKDADIQAYIAAEAQRAAAGVRTLMDRIQASYRPLSANVYSAQTIGNGMVDRVINVALVRGQTAAELARAVAGLVNPATPGGVSYAAMRLARTEINNAFHASSINRMRESAIVEMVNWRLSSSHPELDECDSLAANGPYDVNDVPEKPHPQDLCYLEPDLPDRDTFMKNMFAGRYGDEPWFGYAELPT